MLVRLAERLWEAPFDDSHLADLAGVANRRSHILIAPSGWRSHALIGQWLRWQSQRARLRWEQVFEAGQSKAATSLHRSRPRIVVDRTTSWRTGRLSPPLAIRLLERPLKLLLENRDTDWRFVVCMMPKDQRDWLLKARDKGLVEAEQAGGLSEVLKRVEALEHPDTDQQWIERLRLSVVFDRDADSADRSRPSPESEAVCQAAQRCETPWRLPHHQLRKRSIENYLPNKTLFDWWVPRPGNHAERRQRAQSLKRLREARPEVADQLNMKKGLLGDVAPAIREEVRVQGRNLSDEDLDPLFRGLASEDRIGLEPGFPELAGAAVWHDGVDLDAFDRFVPHDERQLLARSILEHL